MPTIISWNYTVGREASETTAMLKDEGVPSDGEEDIIVKKYIKGIWWHNYVANTCELALEHFQLVQFWI